MSDLNYSLDFSRKVPPAVQEKIHDGMQRAEDNANYFWKQILAGCVIAAARRLPELTIDDVLDELDAINVARKMGSKEPFETHNLSALGPVMRKAAKDRVIKPTLTHRRSCRPEKHGNLHLVWVSNLFSSPASPETSTPGSKPANQSELGSPRPAAGKLGKEKL